MGQCYSNDLKLIKTENQLEFRDSASPSHKHLYHPRNPDEVKFSQKSQADRVRATFEEDQRKTLNAGLGFREETKSSVIVI
jgi:tRNA/tmRNA/rRNA uracil-C5-methylase (TrmA/RlmC/RlmD family)